MKRICTFLIAVALIAGTLGFSCSSDPDPHADLPEDADLVVEKIIGDVHVKYWERVVGGVFHIINDCILVHVDPASGETVKHEQTWREIGMDLGAVQIEPFEPPGGEHYWSRVVVFIEEEDAGDFYTFFDAPQYPLVCWEARYSDGTTVMYDLSGQEIGSGIPAPNYSFLLSGYHTSSDPDHWRRFRENASEWFVEWSNMAFSWATPSPTIISEYVSDPGIGFYYAIAHGRWDMFQADGMGSYYRAAHAEADMEGREAMTFGFIGHCEGMTQTGSGSFSHAFRKGSMTETVTVGYTGMGGSPGWRFAFQWQDLMFQRMDGGHTFRAAFNAACAQYPLIADAVVFVGDPNMRLPQEEAVHFPDANLEAAIREAIGKPTGDIYPSDLVGLTSLGASNRNIADLTGLEYCINLSYLALGGNQISDISPMEGLRNLTTLYLWENQIGDAELVHLMGLTNLEGLGLGGNQITDIAPLAHLINLRGLSLENNQIGDISPLAGLTNLDVLSIWENQITDISPLVGLTTLSQIILFGNQVSDIRPLVDNVGLGEGDLVHLMYNPLSEESINEYIPALQARGVTVWY